MPGLLTLGLAVAVVAVGLALAGLGLLLRTRGGVGALADAESADLDVELSYARAAGAVILAGGLAYVAAGLLVAGDVLTAFGGVPLYVVVTAGVAAGLYRVRPGPLGTG